MEPRYVLAFVVGFPMMTILAIITFVCFCVLKRKRQRMSMEAANNLKEGKGKSDVDTSAKSCGKHWIVDFDKTGDSTNKLTRDNNEKEFALINVLSSSLEEVPREFNVDSNDGYARIEFDIGSKHHDRQESAIKRRHASKKMKTKKRRKATQRTQSMVEPLQKVNNPKPRSDSMRNTLFLQRSNNYLQSDHSSDSLNTSKQSNHIKRKKKMPKSQYAKKTTVMKEGKLQRKRSYCWEDKVGEFPEDTLAYPSIPNDKYNGCITDDEMSSSSSDGIIVQKIHRRVSYPNGIHDSESDNDMPISLNLDQRPKTPIPSVNLHAILTDEENEVCPLTPRPIVPHKTKLTGTKATSLLDKRNNLQDTATLTDETTDIESENDVPISLALTQRPQTPTPNAHIYAKLTDDDIEVTPRPIVPHKLKTIVTKAKLPLDNANNLKADDKITNETGHNYRINESSINIKKNLQLKEYVKDNVKTILTDVTDYATDDTTSHYNECYSMNDKSETLNNVTNNTMLHCETPDMSNDGSSDETNEIIAELFKPLLNGTVFEERWQNEASLRKKQDVPDLYTENLETIHSIPERENAVSPEKWDIGNNILNKNECTALNRPKSLYTGKIIEQKSEKNTFDTVSKSRKRKFSSFRDNKRCITKNKMPNANVVPTKGILKKPKAADIAEESSNLRVVPKLQHGRGLPSNDIEHLSATANYESASDNSKTYGAINNTHNFGQLPGNISPNDSVQSMNPPIESYTSTDLLESHTGSEIVAKRIEIEENIENDLVESANKEVTTHIVNITNAYLQPADVINSEAKTIHPEASSLIEEMRKLIIENIQKQSNADMSEVDKTSDDSKTLKISKEANSNEESNDKTKISKFSASNSVNQYRETKEVFNQDRDQHASHLRSNKHTANSGQSSKVQSDTHGHSLKETDTVCHNKTDNMTVTYSQMGADDNDIFEPRPEVILRPLKLTRSSSNADTCVYIQDDAVTVHDRDLHPPQNFSSKLGPLKITKFSFSDCNTTNLLSNSNPISSLKNDCTSKSFHKLNSPRPQSSVDLDPVTSCNSFPNNNASFLFTNLRREGVGSTHEENVPPLHNSEFLKPLTLKRSMSDVREIRSRNTSKAPIILLDGCLSMENMIVNEIDTSPATNVNITKSRFISWRSKGKPDDLVETNPPTRFERATTDLPESPAVSTESSLEDNSMSNKFISEVEILEKNKDISSSNVLNTTISKDNYQIGRHKSLNALSRGKMSKSYTQNASKEVPLANDHAKNKTPGSSKNTQHHLALQYSKSMQISNGSTYLPRQQVQHNTQNRPKSTMHKPTHLDSSAKITTVRTNINMQDSLKTIPSFEETPPKYDSLDMKKSKGAGVMRSTFDENPLSPDKRDGRSNQNDRPKSAKSRSRSDISTTSSLRYSKCMHVSASTALFDNEHICSDTPKPAISKPGIIKPVDSSLHHSKSLIGSPAPSYHNAATFRSEPLESRPKSAMAIVSLSCDAKLLNPYISTTSIDTDPIQNEFNEIPQSVEFRPDSAKSRPKSAKSRSRSDMSTTPTLRYSRSMHVSRSTALFDNEHIRSDTPKPAKSKPGIIKPVDSSLHHSKSLIGSKPVPSYHKSATFRSEQLESRPKSAMDIVSLSCDAKLLNPSISTTSIDTDPIQNEFNGIPQSVEFRPDSAKSRPKSARSRSRSDMSTTPTLRYSRSMHVSRSTALFDNEHIRSDTPKPAKSKPGIIKPVDSSLHHSKSLIGSKPVPSYHKSATFRSEPLESRPKSAMSMASFSRDAKLMNASISTTSIDTDPIQNEFNEIPQSVEFRPDSAKSRPKSARSRSRSDMSTTPTLRYSRSMHVSRSTALFDNEHIRSDSPKPAKSKPGIIKPVDSSLHHSKSLIGSRPAPSYHKSATFRSAPLESKPKSAMSMASFSRDAQLMNASTSTTSVDTDTVQNEFNEILKSEKFRPDSAQSRPESAMSMIYHASDLIPMSDSTYTLTDNGSVHHIYHERPKSAKFRTESANLKAKSLLSPPTDSITLNSSITTTSSDSKAVTDFIFMTSIDNDSVPNEFNERPMSAKVRPDSARLKPRSAMSLRSPSSNSISQNVITTAEASGNGHALQRASIERPMSARVRPDSAKLRPRSAMSLRSPSRNSTSLNVTTTAQASDNGQAPQSTSNERPKSAKGRRKTEKESSRTVDLINNSTLFETTSSKQSLQNISNQSKMVDQEITTLRKEQSTNLDSNPIPEDTINTFNIAHAGLKINDNTNSDSILLKRNSVLSKLHHSKSMKESKSKKRATRRSLRDGMYKGYLSERPMSALSTPIDLSDLSKVLPIPSSKLFPKDPTNKTLTIASNSTRMGAPPISKTEVKDTASAASATINSDSTNNYQDIALQNSFNNAILPLSQYSKDNPNCRPLLLRRNTVISPLRYSKSMKAAETEHIENVKMFRGNHSRSLTPGPEYVSTKNKTAE